MKCLLKLLVTAALVFALLIGAGVFLIDTILSTAITEGVTYATAQETTLGSVDLSIRENSFGFEDLAIANPPGFAASPMLQVRTFRAAVDSTATSGEVISFDTVLLDGLQLNLELVGSDSNVSALLERLKELQPTTPAGEPEPTQPSEPTSTDPQPSQGPEIRIRKILITGLKSSLRVSDVPLANGVYQLNVPDLVLEDFSSDMDTATMIEWTAYILQEVLTASLSAGEGAFPSEWQGILSSEMLQSGLLEGDFSAAEQQLKQQGADLMKQGKEDPEAVIKALDDLFDKHK